MLIFSKVPRGVKRGLDHLVLRENLCQLEHLVRLEHLCWVYYLVPPQCLERQECLFWVYPLVVSMLTSLGYSKPKI